MVVEVLVGVVDSLLNSEMIGTTAINFLEVCICKI